MKLVNFLALSLVCVEQVLAFRPDAPSFVNSKKCELVSKMTGTKRLATPASREQTVLSDTPTSNITVTLGTGIQLLETDAEQNSFFLNVTVGNDTLPLLLDTGSPYLWVYSSDCDSDACHNKSTLSVAESDETTATFSLAYTSGTASGEIITEDVTLAGQTASDFQLGYADTVPSIFADYPFSGVLGLPSKKATAYSSGLGVLVPDLADQRVISNSSFALLLGNITVDTSGAGLLIIGKDLEELYTGDIYTVDVVSNTASYWEIQVDTLYVDDESALSSNSSESYNAILDSGTTGIILSSQDAKYLHSYFESSVSDGSNYAILCNSTQEISFNIGGHNWTLTSSDYLGAAYSEDSDYYGYCISNIQGLDVTSEKLWILGGLFLKKVYSRFDYANQQVGLAERYYNVNVVSAPTSAVTPATPLITTTSAKNTAATTGTLKTYTASTTASTALNGTNSSSSSTSSTVNAAVQLGSGLWFLVFPLTLLLSI